MTKKQSKFFYQQYTSPEAKNNLAQAKNQSNLLKNQLDNIFLQYEQQAEYLEKLEANQKQKEQELIEREKQVSEREQSIKVEEDRIRKATEEEKQEILKDLKEREERIVKLEKKLSTTTTIETKLGKNQVVKLNVGGKIFATNLNNLLSVKETFFTGYFNDYFSPTKEEDDNSYFIDRPNEQFHLILNYLRGVDIKPKIASLNEQDLNDFIEEVVYYQITPLYELLPLKGKQLLKSKYSIICEGNIRVEFDANYCSSNIQLENPTRVRKSGSQGWNSSILGTQHNHFKVKLISNCSNLMIGFAPRTIKLYGSNSTTCGYYLYCYNGALYSQRGVNSKSYANVIKDGSIVECELLNGNISFKIDGKDYGVAFANIANEDELYPAFDIYNANCTFELINE